MFAFWRFWHPIRDAVLGTSADSTKEETIRRGAKEDAPVIWLLGKTGSGKTSMIHAITGADHAVIGNGFEPCTRTSSVFDFPIEVPLVRFLDTRGLGEAGYEPEADIAFCESRAHLVIAVVRVKDADQDLVLRTVRAARKKNPEWPLIVAQTTLHECYPNRADHVVPYPFKGDQSDTTCHEIGPDLRSSLAHQRALFDRIPGKGAVLFVPLDFTQPVDGYSPADYGIDALRKAIETALPDALDALIRRNESGEVDQIARDAHSLILGFSGAAMGSGAIPVPFVDAAALAAVIGIMLRALGKRYDGEWTARLYGEFTACLGSGVLVGQMAKYALREVAKMIPVWGQTAGLAMSAAAAFALTYAIGRAACVYLGHRRRGLTVAKGDVRQAFREALRRGFEDAPRWRKQKAGATENPQKGKAT
jgi:uncharacterized protein (DUF697 family)